MPFHAFMLCVPQGSPVIAELRERVFDFSLTWGLETVPKRKGQIPKVLALLELFGRRERIRTSDPYHPKVVRYQAAPRAVNLRL